MKKLYIFTIELKDFYGEQIIIKVSNKAYNNFEAVKKEGIDFVNSSGWELDNQIIKIFKLDSNNNFTQIDSFCLGGGTYA